MRTSTRIAHFALAISLTFVTACSDDSGTPSGGNNTTGPMSATINGTQWTANTGAAVATSNLIVINGSRLTAPNYTLQFTLSNVATTGLYPLGVNVTMFGGSAIASSPTLGGWNTPLNGAAGEINITTLTTSRIAGTFTFTASPQAPTTGNLTATNGTFDMPLTGALAALPANAGSKFSGTINGTAFNAGTAAASVTTGASPTFIIAANNVERSIGLTLSNVNAAGTYALGTSPVRTFQISNATGATWASQLTGGSGTVVITSFTASRVIGTFTATLVPLGGGATGNLTVTGSFDMGRL